MPMLWGFIHQMQFAAWRLAHRRACSHLLNDSTRCAASDWTRWTRFSPHWMIHPFQAECPRLALVTRGLLPTITRDKISIFEAGHGPRAMGYPRRCYWFDRPRVMALKSAVVLHKRSLPL